MSDYKYTLNDEVITGYEQERTNILLKNKYIPMVRIIAKDGWVNATDPKGTLSKKL